MDNAFGSTSARSGRTPLIAGLAIVVAAGLAWLLLRTSAAPGPGAEAASPAAASTPVAAQPQPAPSAPSEPGSTDAAAATTEAQAASVAQAPTSTQPQPPPQGGSAPASGTEPQDDDADLRAKYGHLDAIALAERRKVLQRLAAEAEAEAFSKLVAANRHHTIDVDPAHPEFARAAVERIEHPPGVVVHQDTLTRPDDSRGTTLRWGVLAPDEFPELYALRREAQWLNDHVQR